MRKIGVRSKVEEKRKQVNKTKESPNVTDDFYRKHNTVQVNTNT